MASPTQPAPLALGVLVKHLGRLPVFILGAAINAGVIADLFTWVPNPDQSWAFFLLAALWGMADAVWQTQINGKEQRCRPISVRSDGVQACRNETVMV